jgi:hypothetical protein
MTWSQLPPGARLYRVVHTVWAIVNLASLADVWISAACRRRGRTVAASVALLSLEGVGLLIGRGNCPLGPFQQRLGDPEPLFELVLPPRAAKAAVPVLAAVTLAGFAALALRPPRAA